MTRVISVVVTISLILLFAWNWILYNLKFDIKVEQYDEHIALYVKNTFVRTEYREPHYRYEVNWLLMRELNDDELEEAIQKYGSPETSCQGLFNQIHRKATKKCQEALSCS